MRAPNMPTQRNTEGERPFARILSEAMNADPETAAIVALMRSGRRPPKRYRAELREAGSGRALLDEEQGLLAEAAILTAGAEVAAWRRRGIEVVSVLDSRYPKNLRDLSDSPPVLFVAGRLDDRDSDGVAVVGTRRPTVRGAQMTTAIVHRLTDSGYPIISGLAAGIDAIAHQTALDRGGRTIGVIGTGHDHSYPRQNAPLQQRLACEGAVISQFWPESRPSRRTFPLRNTLIAGMVKASVIVEASPVSGTRILAHAAVGLQRAVLILDTLLEQSWARELSERPGVRVVGSPADVTATLERSIGQRALA
jgi:DNA processing protein